MMTGNSRDGVTVLVVEDEVLVREMIIEELGDAGFAVLEAASGETALPLLGGPRPIDVLFIRLPGAVDGWQIAQAARTARPEIAVIYATGYTVDRSAQLPGSIFMRKPYWPSAVVDAIRDLLTRPSA